MSGFRGRWRKGGGGGMGKEVFDYGLCFVFLWFIPGWFGFDIVVTLAFGCSVYAVGFTKLGVKFNFFLMRYGTSQFHAFYTVIAIKSLEELSPVSRERRRIQESIREIMRMVSEFSVYE
jgi:hypothetical protein